MRDDVHIPDLDFPTLSYGNLETPLSLRCLLFQKGARIRVNKVAGLIASGELGGARIERFDLVRRIHEELNGRLVGGGRPDTLGSAVSGFRALFTWAEDSHELLTLGKIQSTYLNWTDWLLHRVQVIQDIQENSAYSQAATVGTVLDLVLERSTPILELTRLWKPQQRKSAVSPQAEKQNLEGTFTFGHLLQDICDGLPVDVVLNNPVPIHVSIRNNEDLLLWGKRRKKSYMDNPPDTHLDTLRARRNANRVAKRRAAWEADRSLRTRYPLANLRIEAELLMFIGQTGMNLAQAHQQKLANFTYVSHTNGYQVKDRKHRRGGEVMFEIYADYKPHFERYLAWRRELFPDSELMFPFVHIFGGSERNSPCFDRIRGVCRNYGLKFVPPAMLRNSRVNWLLRRSGDLELTAEMAQHAEQTLLGIYERPSQQRAMGEIMRFWNCADPSLARTIPPAPGECDGIPIPSPDTPASVPVPDCIQPSGCLWCQHHRDIDSLDYIWSLACFRHLKSIEISLLRPAKQVMEVPPAQHAIARVSEKLHWFQASTAIHRNWVEEALVRIEEGSYHPNWESLINRLEGAA